MASGSNYHLKFDGDKSASIDAYLEYKRIVGDDDGGTLFTEQEYQNYLKEKLPQRLKNRLYVSWTNSTGMDCKMVGPETPCFCQHRYKQHKTDFSALPSTRPILLPCRVKGCPCVSYHYVPTLGGGGQSIRCSCKHQAAEHAAGKPHLCQNKVCQKCSGFRSCYTCGCTQSYMDHVTLVETADEREARGHPVGQAVPYQAMGGITGFSSLAEGYLRLDPSGRGAPPEDVLSEGITSADNAFLKSHVPSIQAHRRAQKLYDKLDEDPERISAARREGESDMDYFERRYQERNKIQSGKITRDFKAMRLDGKTTPAMEKKISTPAEKKGAISKKR